MYHPSDKIRLHISQVNKKGGLELAFASIITTLDTLTCAVQNPSQEEWSSSLYIDVSTGRKKASSDDLVNAASSNV
jgi:hypothetical protein